MKRAVLGLLLLSACQVMSGQNESKMVSKESYDSLLMRVENLEKLSKEALTVVSRSGVAPHKSRLQLGGYGEAVMSRHFYSDNYKRYTDASKYTNAPSYGRFDIPHGVFFVNYDFGKGWKFSTEIEFEHGGTESAMEIEEEETGEYEKEIERGGEVALEQFWIQKTFSNAFNIKMGHIIVPVGLTNQHHMPNEFFTVYRPEGEATIMPCTWHETGVSLWGRVKDWRYEAMLVAGLDADRFGSNGWIANGAGSPYEFKIGTAVAGAFRVDNYTVKGLRIGLSGYIGNSACNSLKASGYSGIKGLVSIGALDFCYDANNVIVRGNFDYGHLSDSKAITAANLASRQDSPSPRTNVASDAICTAVEAGYNVFALFGNQKLRQQDFYVFGRYDYYDSMYKTEDGILDNECWGRQKVTVGLNYRPIREITIKAEYSSRLFKSQYNTENTLALAVTYTGMFNF